MFLGSRSAVNLVVQYACLLFATHHGRHKLAHAMHEASSMLGGMTRHGRSLEFPAGRGACTTAARVPREAALCQSLFCLLHTHDMRIGLAGKRVVCFACLHWMVMISIFLLRHLPYTVYRRHQFRLASRVCSFTCLSTISF